MNRISDIRRVINGQRQSIGGKLSIDKQSIVENDYKMKLLEILKTQDKKNLQEHSSVDDSKVTDFDLFRLCMMRSIVMVVVNGLYIDYPSMN